MTVQDEVAYRWRGDFGNDEVNFLHRAAFGGPISVDDWQGQLRGSLGWVCARRSGELVEFVNVVWDGGTHAFILDTAVAPDWARRGIGTQLIKVARTGAADAGCRWLHVDFEPHLASFYIGACGFRATEAGVLDLTR